MGKVLLEEQSLIDIANSIRSKTGSEETMTPGEMATNIDNLIVGGVDLSEYFTENITGHYNDDETWMKTLKKFPPLKNTGTTCKYMFYNLIFPDVDLSNFETNNVTDMSYMFAEAKYLTVLDLSNFLTNNVTDMQHMFNGCLRLNTLNLSSFNIDKVTSTRRMFYRCQKLKHLDIRNFDFTNVSDYYETFGTSNNSDVPADCLIIVKDEEQKTWLNTNFSRLTNVKTVAEYESEA